MKRELYAVAGTILPFAMINLSCGDGWRDGEPLLAAGRVDALQRDAEVQRQIRLHVVVRQAAAGRSQRLEGELRQVGIRRRLVCVAATGACEHAVRGRQL